MRLLRSTVLIYCFFPPVRNCLKLSSINIFFSIPVVLTFQIGRRQSTFAAHQIRNTLKQGAIARDSAMDVDWRPLDPESLVSAKCLIEQTLCVSSETQPQLAKDFQYANAVLETWKQEEAADSNELWSTEYSPITYTTNSDKQSIALHGYLVRQRIPDQTSLPNRVVLFFHTAAGPHDLFLLYKAAALVNTMNVVVIIADLLSDDTGWAWDPDRSRYEAVRDTLLHDTPAGRIQLQERLQAAIDTAHSIAQVETMAAFGWCLGGHAVLELARMHIPKMRAMVTFHGVFSGVEYLRTDDNESAPPSSPCQVLICNGSSDPFVSDESLEMALRIFQHHKQTVSLLTLKNAKHGFTNPAQEFNTNPAFAYSPEAAQKAWNQAVGLLRRTLA